MGCGVCLGLEEPTVRFWRLRPQLPRTFPKKSRTSLDCVLRSQRPPRIHLVLVFWSRVGMDPVWALSASLPTSPGKTLRPGAALSPTRTGSSEIPGEATRKVTMAAAPRDWRGHLKPFRPNQSSKSEGIEGALFPMHRFPNWTHFGIRTTAGSMRWEGGQKGSRCLSPGPRLPPPRVPGTSNGPRPPPRARVLQPRPTAAYRVWGSRRWGRRWEGRATCSCPALLQPGEKEGQFGEDWFKMFLFFCF
jgi:hypothetical protein